MILAFVAVAVPPSVPPSPSSAVAVQVTVSALATAVVDRSRLPPVPRLPALRRLMLDAAPELLYEVDGSRVAENMLLEYETQCTTLGHAA